MKSNRPYRLFAVPLPLSKIVSGALAACLTFSFIAGAKAATVGYWRFEDGAFLADSSGNGLDLTASATSPTQVALASSGSTSEFYSTIPQTGATNGSAASLSGTYFYHSDASVLTMTDFTVEALLNYGGSGTMIASQWGNNQRSWEFNISSGKLALTLNSDGTTATTTSIVSTLAITSGHDYYVAVSYDNAGQVVFYLQDLTAGTELQSQTLSTSVTSIFDSKGYLAIGAYNSSGTSFGSALTGYIDEVRISNSVLGQNDLLAVPEPSSVVLAALGVAGVALLFRRRSLNA